MPAHLPVKAKEKMEVSLGEKERAKEPLSGAKAHTAKARARSRHSTTAGASSHLKEEGLGTNGAHLPLITNGLQHPTQTNRGCRQQPRRPGREHRPSRLGPEHRGPERRKDLSARWREDSTQSPPRGRDFMLCLYQLPYPRHR